MPGGAVSSVSSEKVSANKALIHRWFQEVWNQGKVETIHELLSHDGLADGLGEAGSTVRGPQAFVEFWQLLRTAFPDIDVTVTQLVEEGEYVAARFGVTMTYTGGGLGFPANGKQAKIEGMSLIRIQNGKLIEGFNVWDQRALLTQLGAPGTPDPMRLIA